MVPIILLVGGIQMSKREKLLQKIRNNPTNVKFETLQKLLQYYGFDERQPRSGASHYTYPSKEYVLTGPKKNPVNKEYVKKALKIFDEIDSKSN
jgi:hypothetical protein